MTSSPSKTDEIEITPEMIEAGVLALGGAFDQTFVLSESAVRDVFVAMLSVSNKASAIA
jgi:hypothetical protein